MLVTFEAHPAVQHERGEPVARFLSKRRAGVEPVRDFRRIDAQEADAAVPGHVDRVAVDDRAHEHGIGSCRIG